MTLNDNSKFKRAAMFNKITEKQLEIFRRAEPGKKCFAFNAFKNTAKVVDKTPSKIAAVVCKKKL